MWPNILIEIYWSTTEQILFFFKIKVFSHPKDNILFWQFSSFHICEQVISYLINIKSNNKNSFFSVADEIRICLSKIPPN